MMRAKDRMTLFGVLLLAVLALTILFASGILRFGTNPASTYVVYVLAGLLSGSLCYGLLESGGKLDAKYANSRLQISGALLAVVVVAGGGGAYERWLRTPEHFTLRIRILDDETHQPQRVTGSISIYLGANRWSVQLPDTAEAAFEMIPVSVAGNLAKVSLVAPPFEAVRDAKVLVSRDDVGDLHVVRNVALEQHLAGTVRSKESGQPIVGAHLVLVGAGCPSPTNSEGYFEFSCKGVDRTERRTAQIRLPGREQFCADVIRLQDPPQLADVTVSEDCVISSNPASDVRPPKPPGRDPPPEVQPFVSLTEQVLDLATVSPFGLADPFAGCALKCGTRAGANGANSCEVSFDVDRSGFVTLDVHESGSREPCDSRVSACLQDCPSLVVGQIPYSYRVKLTFPGAEVRQ